MNNLISYCLIALMACQGSFIYCRIARQMELFFCTFMGNVSDFSNFAKIFTLQPAFQALCISLDLKSVKRFLS